MRRLHPRNLINIFVVHIWHKTHFRMTWPNYLNHVIRKPFFGACDQVRLSFRNYLESWNFSYSKMYYTIQAASNKGTDQNAWMHRVIYAFVVRIWHKRFSHDVAQLSPELDASLVYHDMTKPIKWLCAQRRLISACPSFQSNQSLRCALNE